MRKVLRWIAAVLLLLVVSVVVFYVWASLPVHDDASYNQIRTYDAQPLRALPDTFSVATYNIGYLSGMANNRPIRESQAFYASNLESARELLHRMNADIIGFQEIDFGSRRSYDYHQMDSLAVSGGYAYGAMAANWDVRYVPFPYGVPRVNFGRIFSGQAVLSRLPISAHERIVLDMPPNPFWYNAFYLDRLAQVVYFDTDPRIAAINVHLEAFHRETREEQATELLAMVDSLASDYAILLFGDFNAIPSELYREDVVTGSEAEQRRGERTMELLTSHDILDAAYTSDLLADETSLTFPADEPRIKIDHVLYDTRYFRLVDVIVLDAEGPPADHRPVLASFRKVDEVGS